MIDKDGNVEQEEFGANVTIEVSELLEVTDVTEIWASNKWSRRRIRKRTRRKSNR